jgi:hypothetical protein
MVDFPTSLFDFERRFPDEASCAALAVRGALAHGLSLPGVRSRQGLAAWRKGFHLRMRRLR